MCIKPLHIRTRSKYINKNSLHKIAFDVPCGECCECLAAKLNEYYFRSYYQAIETWNKGGYCLFDTLTYDNEHVPTINDILSQYHINYRFTDDKNFTCFNYEDVLKFFKRLRRALEYRNYNVSENLKYFLCSEYGEDPRYTHRPHYHVMFYVTDTSLSSIDLSNLIDLCWQNGRTDGAPYKGEDYVLSKRVFKAGEDDLHMQNVCHYIGKYMTKDSSFTSVVKDRFSELRTELLRLKANGFSILDYEEFDTGFTESAKLLNELYINNNSFKTMLFNYYSLLFQCDDYKKLLKKYPYEPFNLEYYDEYGHCISVSDVHTLEDHINNSILNECNIMAHDIIFNLSILRVARLFDEAYNYYDIIDDEKCYRVDKLVNKIKNDLKEFEKDKAGSILKKLKSLIIQFIRLSQGFGAYMIDALTPEWIYENNCVRMPDLQHIWKEIPIPQYISTKLFKEKKTDIFGDTYYTWSDYGNEFRMKHIEESIDNKIKKFKESTSRDNLKLAGMSDSNIDGLLSALSSSLGARKPSDMFYYQLFIQGRIWYDNFIEPDYESFYFVDLHDLFDSNSIPSDKLFKDFDDLNLYSDYVYHDNSLDKALAIYSVILRFLGEKKQNTFDYRKALEARYKALGLKK